nr:3-hydroxyacyl-CoA dehydrogenase/enoyl-CoA hydratase family protein [Lottiidibacillus patelloidae]
MTLTIKKAAVIGSGVMGSGIAAHLANAGIPTLLLDIIPNELSAEEKKAGLTLDDKSVRNRIVDDAKKKLLKQNPAPLTVKENVSLISVGNLEDDMEKLADADWIIEVVVENLEIKKKVFANIEAYRKETAIVSSNTSGISVNAMIDGRSESFKKHFLGTHFFNPPRYLKLLEIIPTKDTDHEIVQFMRDFAENFLGKGVVICKDTPNFIANRIGTYGLMITVQEMLAGGYSVGEVDSVTGTLLGRPKSATFRTLDVVGLDTFLHVANNMYEALEGDEKEVFHVPSFMTKMVENNWLGSKSGQGFYLKKKSNSGSEIFEINPETLEYEPQKKLKANLPKVGSKKDKLRALIYSDDRAGQLTWNILMQTLLYSAKKVNEISDDIVAIDQAMKWGFGWEMGPFETWDAIGVAKSVAKMEEQGAIVPKWVKEMLANGHNSFYRETDGQLEHVSPEGTWQQKKENKKIVYLTRNPIIQKNSGANLVDIGDGVACLQFTTKSHAIGLDIMQMISKSLDEVNKNYEGLVIGNHGTNFSVGANIMMILMEAQDMNFFEIDLVVRQFQNALMKVKYNEKPVIAAPYGMTLGGGTEVALPCAGMQVSVETYMGLVETGVGIIPGGGGNKELYIRQIENLPKKSGAFLQEAANKTFETIAMAKVSKSGHEARKLGYVRERDDISFNNDFLIHDAKSKLLSLVEAGYQAPQRNKIPVVGEAGYAVMLMGAKTMHNSGYISDHDLKIAEKLAYVIAGGYVPEGSEVDEQYLLDIEREAFVSLVGEPKTQARMHHMLVKGKPLRN